MSAFKLSRFFLSTTTEQKIDWEISKIEAFNVTTARYIK